MTNKQLLLKVLNRLHANYNPELKLLRAPFDSPGYHTALVNVEWVHETRESLNYALALLDSEDNRFAERAFSILEKVVSLQDSNSEHSTYGIWSWYYEEPLAQMSPPDWNWADFCGKSLLLAMIRHKSKIPPYLAEQVRVSIFRACEAIIKRNVGPNYTNITIMGAFVTLIAGEYFEHHPFRDYGLKRLKRFDQYTKRLNVFEEYNSPHYTPIAIQELSSILTETSNAEARIITGQLLDIAWRTLAEHYHSPTRQWSGPHSRSYSTMLTLADLSFIQLATSGTVTFLAEMDLVYDTVWYGNRIQCPKAILPLFKFNGEKTVREMIEHDETTGLKKWATTYMNPSYTLSTFNKEIMWNQRRNLVGYIKNGEASTYVHMKFLRNGYDYYSVIFTCARNGIGC